MIQLPELVVAILDDAVACKSVQSRSSQTFFLRCTWTHHDKPVGAHILLLYRAEQSRFQSLRTTPECTMNFLWVWEQSLCTKSVTERLTRFTCNNICREHDVFVMMITILYTFYLYQKTAAWILEFATGHIIISMIFRRIVQLYFNLTLTPTRFPCGVLTLPGLL